jgi:glutaredoxin
MTTTHPVASPGLVTVYGADWCPDCRRSKRLLVALGTPFLDVDTGAPGVRDALRSAGYPAIPVVVLPGGTILMEPSDAELSAALDGLPVEMRGATLEGAAR